jgi:hypothetical protein
LALAAKDLELVATIATQMGPKKGGMMRSAKPFMTNCPKNGLLWPNPHTKTFWASPKKQTKNPVSKRF